MSGVLVLHGFPLPVGRDLPALDAALDGFIYGGNTGDREDPETGAPLPDGVEGFAISGGDDGGVR